MSNASRERQRLVALDVKIQDFELLYLKEVAHERAIGKHNLLHSRAIRNRIITLEQQRRALQRTLRNNNTAAANYKVELDFRQSKVDNAILDLDARKNELATELVNVQQLEQMRLLNPGVEIDYSTLEYLTAEVPKQQTRLRNYERALTNWINNGKNIAPRTLTKYQREYTAELESVPVEAEVIRTPESYLNKMGDWDIKVSNDNPASLDLITPPAPVLATQDVDEQVKTFELESSPAETTRKRVVIDFGD